eukprot:27314-Chlamydomonas_euryale.AAC.2
MPSDRRFHMDASTARSCVGTGLAMMQLNWPGEALQLDDKGGLKLLPNTILENMEERGISVRGERASRSRDMQVHLRPSNSRGGVEEGRATKNSRQRCLRRHQAPGPIRCAPMLLS